jgi:hypothetical protein
MAGEEGEHVLGRRALIKAGILGGVAFGFAAGFGTKSLIERYTPVVSAQVGNHYPFAEAGEYPILVTKGINLRSEPLIPPRSRFYQRNNTIAWDKISAVNGMPLNGKDAFVLPRPSFYVGQEVDPK